LLSPNWSLEKKSVQRLPHSLQPFCRPSAGVPTGLQQGWAGLPKLKKLHVLDVNFSYHSQTMLPVVWKKKLLQPAVLFTVGWFLRSSKWLWSQ